MARQSQVRDLIFVQNAEPIPAQNIAFTTTAASSALPGADLDGGVLVRPVGAGSNNEEGVDLILQTDQDVYVRFASSATPLLGQVTIPTGINPGFLLKAGQSLAVCPRTTSTFISVKGATASGNLTIFTSR